MQSINYKLFWIRLVDKSGDLVAREDFNKTFGSERLVLQFVEFYREEHQRIFGMDLEDAPFYQQIAKEEVVKDIIGQVAIYTGVKRDAILSKLRDRDIVDARRIISGISSELGLTPSQINKMTGFDRAGVYSHVRTCREMIETDQDFKNKYEAILNKIIS